MRAPILLAAGVSRLRIRTPALVAAGCLAFAAVLHFAPVAQGHGLDHPGPQPAPAALAALQAEAFRQAEAPPGYRRSHTVQVRLAREQGVLQALEAAGVAPGDASAAVSALSDEIDTVNTRDGQTLEVSLAEPRSGAGARLIGVALDDGSDGSLILSRTAVGGFRLFRETTAPTYAPPRVIQGDVQGSLYLSMTEAGARLEDAAQALRLLAHRLDLSRDVDTGDRFRLVFDEGGSGGLRYLEVRTRTGITRLYGLSGAGGRVVWVDDEARPLQGGLLRTPIDAARITSGFGLRMHPILGFSRMHQGIDFGAPVGSAVYAAGDGVVEEARWAGGYGRWLKIRHEGGWETGYAHLSGFAPGASPGAFVHQGQLVGYVGATGLATGPHLHYEVIRSGQRIDPRTADPQGSPMLGAAQTAELETLKARLAALAANPSVAG
jgi:murein DD-endopeptidase MepM/ murein hydrolase activator NlpD